MQQPVQQQPMAYPQSYPTPQQGMQPQTIQPQIMQQPQGMPAPGMMSQDQNQGMQMQGMQYQAVPQHGMPLNGPQVQAMQVQGAPGMQAGGPSALGMQPQGMQQQADMQAQGMAQTAQVVQQATQMQSGSGNTSSIAAALATLNSSQLSNLAGLLGTGEESWRGSRMCWVHAHLKATLSYTARKHEAVCGVCSCRAGSFHLAYLRKSQRFKCRGMPSSSESNDKGKSIRNFGSI